jgi:hypothetical protein
MLQWVGDHINGVLDLERHKTVQVNDGWVQQVIGHLCEADWFTMLQVLGKEYSISMKSQDCHES